jgi:branched-chain amino acid transport system permease protein
MSEPISSVAPPLPTAAEKLKFYGLWLLAAVVLLLLAQLFT